jgi:hypothetical protein
MQGDLFILESWTKVTTWVEKIKLVAMKLQEANQIEFHAQLNA